MPFWHLRSTTRLTQGGRQLLVDSFYAPLTKTIINGLHSLRGVKMLYIYSHGYYHLRMRRDNAFGRVCLFRNDLLCVEWDVKPYTLTHSLFISATILAQRCVSKVWRPLSQHRPLTADVTLQVWHSSLFQQ